MSRKKCPLIYVIIPGYDAHHSRCMEDRCAWWNEDAQKCAMIVISEEAREALDAR